MSRKRKRRRFLAGLGVAGVGGLSGCLGQVENAWNGDESDDTDEATPTETPEADDDDDETPEPDEKPVHSGENIPTYPYMETASEPLTPREDPEAENPVLTADDIDDFDPAFVADPCLFVEEDDWHMFFDATADGRGRICHATSDDDGVSWEYDQIVLNMRHNVSFPSVFKWEGDYFMTAQEPSSDSTSLYKANAFPYEWYRTARLFNPEEYGHGMSDRVLFRWDDTWWCIGGDAREDTYLYYSDELETSGWQPHEENPVVEDRPAGSRPGGRPVVRDDHVLMFFQSLVGGFGMEINAYRISELTPSTYEDERHPASPIIEGTDRLDDDDEPVWNAARMHQFDPWYRGEGNGWRVAVDGDDGNDDWKIGIYHVRE